MSVRPDPLPPMPDVTAAAVRTAFPKGNLSGDLRAECGTLSTDQRCADLSLPPRAAPWKWPPGVWRWSSSCSLWQGSRTGRQPLPCAAASMGHMPSASLCMTQVLPARCGMIFASDALGQNIGTHYFLEVYGLPLPSLQLEFHSVLANTDTQVRRLGRGKGRDALEESPGISL